MNSSYDVEDESILSTVFKDAFPDSWRGNSEFAQYLSELSSYGVDKLNREPERLSEERSHILEQTQDLAFHNYKTFIQTAECSKEIFQDFQVIEQHVDSLLSKLPILNQECAKFLKDAQEINNSRRMNSMTLQRHTQLLEILEMPQLMDTCVRNGYYEEALELAAHVKRLEKKHSQIPVIVHIVKEVKNSSQLMLNQLIHQLRSNIQLPACLRVIGYLRRMDVFTEAELRIKFLQARDAWFQGMLLGIPSDDSYYHINKTIEVSRVHLFDIITQYRAIFSDEDPLMSNVKEDGTNEAALFHGWVVQKVSQFLGTLEQDLQHGVGGRLDALLGQCMYFGLSFSRVGADFRGLLAPVFQRAALQSFVQSITETNVRFDEAMQSYTLLGTLSTVPSSALALASQTRGGLYPPSILLEFNPLAAYCNNILTSFNDLRLCAPLTLACDVSGQVEMSLVKTVDCILAYHRAEESAFDPQERDKFLRFCQVFGEELVPFLNKCLQSLFPPTDLARMLGLHTNELNKMGFIGVMDLEALLKPMQHLLPAKPEPFPDHVIGQSDTSTDVSSNFSQSDHSADDFSDQSEISSQLSGVHVDAAITKVGDTIKSINLDTIEEREGETIGLNEEENEDVEKASSEDVKESEATSSPEGSYTDDSKSSSSQDSVIETDVKNKTETVKNETESVQSGKNTHEGSEIATHEISPSDEADVTSHPAENVLSETEVAE